jgi:hypothetical protein
MNEVIDQTISNDIPPDGLDARFSLCLQTRSL